MIVAFAREREGDGRVMRHDAGGTFAADQI